MSAATAIAFPALMELSAMVRDQVAGTRRPGPVGVFAPELWVIYWVYGLVFMTLPTTVGSVLLQLNLHGWCRIRPWPVWAIVMLGAALGPAVAVAGAYSLYEVAFFTVTFRDGRVFPLLLCGWDLLLYTGVACWTARRISVALRAEQLAEPNTASL